MSHDVSAYRLKDGKCTEEFYDFNRTSGASSIMALYKSLNAEDLCGSPPFSGTGGREFTVEEIRIALQKMREYDYTGCPDIYEGHDRRELILLEKCLEVQESVYILFA